MSFSRDGPRPLCPIQPRIVVLAVSKPGLKSTTKGDTGVDMQSVMGFSTVQLSDAI